MFQANDGLHGTELWRLDPLASVFRITQIVRQGNDVSVTWTTPGGWTNVVQSANGMGGTNNFSDRSAAIVAANGDIVTTNYLDVGGALGHPVPILSRTPGTVARVLIQPAIFQSG